MRVAFQEGFKRAPSWYKQPEWWLCILGVPTLGFVAWQTWSTASAAKAALLNAQALINSERAWIMAELSSYGKDPEIFEVVEGTTDFSGERAVETTRVKLAKLTCKNQGRSPAWIDAVYGQVSIDGVDILATTEIDPSKTGSHGPMGPIGPGGEASRGLELVCSDWTGGITRNLPSLLLYRFGTETVMLRNLRPPVWSPWM
jgi:hypothetical protein